MIEKLRKTGTQQRFSDGLQIRSRRTLEEEEEEEEEEEAAAAAAPPSLASEGRD